MRKRGITAIPRLRIRVMICTLKFKTQQNQHPACTLPLTIAKSTANNNTFHGSLHCVDRGLKFSHFGGVAGGGRWDLIAAG